MSEARNSIFTEKRMSSSKVDWKFLKNKLLPLGGKPYDANKFGGKDKYVDGTLLQAKSPPRFKTRQAVIEKLKAENELALARELRYKMGKAKMLKIFMWFWRK
jgi:hypothetical protein